MSSVQIADQTFVAAAPSLTGELVANPASWREWWPDLRLTVREERGAQGVRWSIAGALSGTMEVWIEPALDGGILHYFLHAEPVSAVSGAKLNALRQACRIAGTRMAFAVKATAEQGRAPGSPAAAHSVESMQTLGGIMQGSTSGG